MYQISLTPCEVPFFNNICNATESDGFLSFGHKIPSKTVTQLYVRECYRSIASQIEPGINKAIIGGDTGVGKSLFLIYLLWKLVKENKRILIMYHPYKIYYDGEGYVFHLDSIPSNLERAFWNDTLWCLFDAKCNDKASLYQLPYSFCTFVMSNSPRLELAGSFRKPPVPQEFHVPHWTEVEMEAIVPLFADSMQWRSRCKIIGGLPRYVFELSNRTPKEVLQGISRDWAIEDFIRRTTIK